MNSLRHLLNAARWCIAFRRSKPTRGAVATSPVPPEKVPLRGGQGDRLKPIHQRLARLPARRHLSTALLALACAFPARAEVYYFNSSNALRIENEAGQAINPVVAGVQANMNGNFYPGLVASDGVVEFTFPASLNFAATDRVYFRGPNAVRIIVQGNITIPAGMIVEATGGAGGGPGGSGANAGVWAWARSVRPGALQGGAASHAA